MKKIFVLAFSIALGTTAWAEEVKKLTLDLRGVDCEGCVKAVTAALKDGGLKLEEEVSPSKKEPSRVKATAELKADLSAAAAKVQKAKRPHSETVGVAVILFAKLDKDSAKKAEEALTKLKGVDKKETKVDEKKGELSVRISGEEKITAEGLLEALKKDAGITASLTKEKEEEKKKE